jgi:hypothetical protein
LHSLVGLLGITSIGAHLRRLRHATIFYLAKESLTATIGTQPGALASAIQLAGDCQGLDVITIKWMKTE